MQIADHLEHLQRDGNRLAEAATSLDAQVPACPGWTVRRLVTHIGGVHRYAAQIVREQLAEDPAETEDDLAQPGSADVVEWFRAGLAELLTTLRTADPATQCMTFYAAPSAVEFWARRQAHETAIHRADAESATGPITPIAVDLAVDGIDEMINGFAVRRRSFRHVEAPRTLALQPDEAEGLTVTLAPDGIRAEPGVDGADVTVSGTASDLYLWLWNRAAAVKVSGDQGVADLWQRIRIRWA